MTMCAIIFHNCTGYNVRYLDRVGDQWDLDREEGGRFHGARNINPNDTVTWSLRDGCGWWCMRCQVMRVRRRLRVRVVLRLRGVIL